MAVADEDLADEDLADEVFALADVAAVVDVLFNEESCSIKLICSLFIGKSFSSLPLLSLSLLSIGAVVVRLLPLPGLNRLRIREPRPIIVVCCESLGDIGGVLGSLF